ncbi:PLP-dependent aminotransferase family protein [soil metagenome]
MARLLGELPRGAPAYEGLAARIRRLIAEGRLGADHQLPSERSMAIALGVSRTTVTRAYTQLTDTGYAHARQGSGTAVRVPGSSRGALGGLLAVQDVDETLIDLTCAAPAAVPHSAAAIAWAAEQMPAQLRGTGYYPEGLPELRDLVAARYAERGLPTSPGQVLITSGAQAGLALATRLLISPGDRVLAEDPSYPNSIAAVRGAGGRLVTHPMDAAGWDPATLQSTLRRAAPSVAVLMPDFHNPTGALMDAQMRTRLAEMFRRAGTTVVVDESSAELLLRQPSEAMPPPFAAFGADVITVGSASKSLWGGFRIGWVRAPEHMMAALVGTRASVDLGSSVLDQLAVSHLLRDLEPALAERRAGLRHSRDALAAAVRSQLPSWQFTLPGGGLSLWCALPRPYGPELVQAAERTGVLLVAGGRFGADGGLAANLRLPFTVDESVAAEAVRRVAVADERVRSSFATVRRRSETGRTPLIA